MTLQLTSTWQLPAVGLAPNPTHPPPAAAAAAGGCCLLLLLLGQTGWTSDVAAAG